MKTFNTPKVCIILFIILFLSLPCVFAQKSVSTKSSSPKPTGSAKVNKKSSSFNVSKLFAQAQKLYEEEKYQEAIKIYHLILQKYPQYEPAIIQYAKALYKLDRLAEAYVLFLKTNIQLLDIETTYEYGLTCFWQKNYGLAYAAFKRIPPEHSLSDLSNYYGGIAALQLNYLEDAESMLQKAVVLPDNLIKSKEMHLKYIRELKLVKEKEYLNEQLKKEKQKLVVQDTEDHDKQEKNNQKKLSKEALTTPEIQINNDKTQTGFFTLKKHTFIGYEYNDELYDIHGYASNTFRSNKIKFNFANGPQLNFKTNKKSADAVVGTQIEFLLENMQKKGEEKRNIQFDNTEDIVRVISTQKADDNINSLSLSAAPFFEHPLYQNIWAGIILKGLYLISDINTSDKTYAVDSTASIGAKYASHQVQGKYSYQYIWINKFKNYQHINNINLLVDMFVSNFIFHAELNHQYIGYFVSDVNGPDSTTSLGIGVAHDFPLNLKIGLNGYIQYLNSFVLFNVDPYEKISANAIVYSSKAYLEWVLFNRFNIKASQIMQSYKWDKITPKEAVDTFKLNQYNYQSQTNVQLELNILF